VAAVDDRDDKQRQAHLASAQYRGVHGAYGISTHSKFAAANRPSRCKNRIEVEEWLALKYAIEDQKVGSALKSG
jgi:hypothetical protein